MRLLDLYCCAGGCTRGYQNAGFEVVGVDIEPQPHYIGEHFIQADALEFMRALLDGDAWKDNHGCLWHLSDFDAIHASPPCQWVTHAGAQWRKAGRTYPELVAPTRQVLEESGLPYVIEQPVGAALKNPTLLNGATFGLRVKRDRYFETSFHMPLQLLAGDERPAHFGRPFDARRGELFYPVGHFSGVAEGRKAMGLGWYMTQHEVAQAIPPAYCEFIGRHLMAALLTGAQGAG